MLLVANRREKSPVIPSATGRSATLGALSGAGVTRVFFDGHQLASPTSAAMAGTVMVRTTNVSISRPMPMMSPRAILDESA